MACQAAGSPSGGECICQKVGVVFGNAMPVSTVRLRFVPIKTTRQSCSRCVSWFVSNNICPLRTGTLSSSRAPFAFTVRVCASSWKGSLPGPCPYTYTEMSSAQRWLRRRSGISIASVVGGFGCAFPARTNCACFNASKIRLIVYLTARLWLIDPKTKYSERAKRGKTIAVPFRIGNPVRNPKRPVPGQLLKSSCAACRVASP